jgi:hypothetical protein
MFICILYSGIYVKAYENEGGLFVLEYIVEHVCDVFYILDEGKPQSVL